jgi:hypothetical protein
MKQNAGTRAIFLDLDPEALTMSGAIPPNAPVGLLTPLEFVY